MVTYSIVIEKRATKELRKLPQVVRSRIVCAIDDLAQDPRPNTSRKMVGSTGYRLRVGDYRIIYEVNDTIVTVFIIKIGHRREIYR